MNHKSGGLALIGALLAAAPTLAQDGGATTGAPVIQVPTALPPAVVVTPSPAPANTPAPAATALTRPATAPSRPAATASPAASSTRGTDHRYTWHGAWRDGRRHTGSPQVGFARVPGPAAAPVAAPVPTEVAQTPDLTVAAAPPPAPRPHPAITPTPMPTVATMSSDALWPWVALAGLAILIVAGWALWRLRRHENEALIHDTYVEPIVEAEPERPTQPVSVPAPIAPVAAAPIAAAPVAVAPIALAPVLAAPEPVEAPPVAAPTIIAPLRPEPVVVPAGRARLTAAFSPLRAGVNLLSATAEGEVTVTNTGDAIAEDVRAEMRLVSAHAGQDEDIAAIYLTPIARPATPAFSLAPGESRQLRLTAALSREAIRVLTAADRPMFVPLAVVNATAATRGLQVQTGQAFAIGIERPGSGKLAPFWLDGPSRMYNSVTAIAQGSPFER